MLKTVNFENVNFNEKFSYMGRTYKKVVCANDEPGAVRIFDGTVYNSCQDWDCLVGRKEENAIEPPKKERKKYIFRDTETEDVYGLLLTDEQMAFCTWLNVHEFLINDLDWEQVENLDFIEIS